MKTLRSWFLLLGLVFAQPIFGTLRAAEIDVMVCYTPMARDVAGGKQALMAFLTNSVELTNEALGNSQVSHTVRLARVEEVDYVEASDITWQYPDDEDMRRLKDPHDGYLDEVHVFMDLYAADLVMLLNGRGGGKGGVLSAWTLVGAAGLHTYTFAHEIGHNLGCRHAIGDSWKGDGSDAQAANGYAHGWSMGEGTNRVCTIMSYRGPDYRYDHAATRIPYYSNPDVLYGGMPTGDEDLADNARKIEERGQPTADWRIPHPLTAPAPTGVTASDMTANRVTISWSSVGADYLYRVFRQTGAAEPVPIGVWVSGASFVDDKARALTNHLYYVQAAKLGERAPGPFSSPDEGSCLLRPPENVQAGDGTRVNRVEVTWDADPAASFYRVYRSNTRTSAISAIGDWQENTRFYDNDPPLGNTVYYYWVKSAGPGIAGVSVFSEPDRGHAALRAPNAMADDLANSEYLRVWWNDNAKAPYYRVYRSQGTNEAVAVSDWQTDNTFLDYTAIPGVRYHYRLRCAPTASANEPSGLGSSNQGVRQFEVPSTPEITHADTEGVELAWAPVYGSNAHYQVRAYPTTVAGYLDYAWTTGTTQVATGLVAGVDYEFRVRVSIGESAAAATGWSDPVTGGREMPAPSNLTASDGAYTNKIELQCDPVDGATEYRFYTASSLSGTPAALGDWQPGTTFEHSVAPGTTHFYWVKASNGEVESDYSAPDAGESGLPPPRNLVAGKGTHPSHVELNWSPVTGSSHYAVYRSTSLGGARAELVPWTAGLVTYQDDGVDSGTAYFYWVKAATDGAGGHASAFSDYDIGFLSLPPPENVTATRGAYADKVIVRWDAAPGAGAHQLFRSTESTGAFTAVTGWLPDPDLVDTSAVPDEVYYYAVRAAAGVAGSGASELSDPTVGSVKSSAPIWKKVSLGDFTDRIRLTWSAATNIQYFQIHRMEEPDGMLLRIRDWAAGKTYDDTTAEAGKTYAYQLVGAVGPKGSVPTLPSDMRRGFISPPPPDAPIVSDALYTDRVAISWAAQYRGAHYRVFRASSNAGPVRDISGWIPDLQFSDTMVSSGVEFLYSIETASNDEGLNASGAGPSAPGSRRLSPPATVAATDAGFPDKVRVYWSGVANAGAYQVLRALSPGGRAEPVSGWIEDTSIFDTDAVFGQVYEYSVVASPYLSGDKASEASAVDTGWAGYPLPEMPGDPLPAHLTNRVRPRPELQWGACKGADRYRLEVWTDDAAWGVVGKDGELDPRLQGLGSPAFPFPEILQVGTTYYWRVYAQNNGGESAGPVWSFSTVPRPLLVNARAENGQITLQWEDPAELWIDYSPVLLPEPDWSPFAGPFSNVLEYTGLSPTNGTGAFRLRLEP